MRDISEKRRRANAWKAITKAHTVVDNLEKEILKRRGKLLKRFLARLGLLKVDPMIEVLRSDSNWLKASIEAQSSDYARSLREEWLSPRNVRR